jgi:hypothetical protein
LVSLPALQVLEDLLARHLSVCGVLNTNLRTGLDDLDAAGERDEGHLASSNTGTIAMVVPVVGPPTMRRPLSSSTRPRREGARLVGVAAVVVEHELDLAAVDAAAWLMRST